MAAEIVEGRAAFEKRALRRWHGWARASQGRSGRLRRRVGAARRGDGRRHGWPVHVIEGAAHAPHIEQPDAFLETLTAVADRR